MPPLVSPQLAIIGFWAFWAVTWLLASAWSKRPAGRAGLYREWPYRVLTLAGAVLMWQPGGQSTWAGWQPVWPDPAGAVGWALASLVACSVIFAWWARIHLGSLWSSSVTKKAQHRIVDTGPYAIVRHPIYTGLIFGLTASVAAHATPMSVVGYLLLVGGIVLKARLEERFLREELGAEEYDAYTKRVPMLVPFTKTRITTRE